MGNYGSRFSVSGMRSRVKEETNNPLGYRLSHGNEAHVSLPHFHTAPNSCAWRLTTSNCHSRAQAGVNQAVSLELRAVAQKRVKSFIAQNYFVGLSGKSK